MIAPETIAERISAALLTALSASGWRESVWSPALVGRDAQGSTVRLFSVEVPRTSVASDGRQRVTGRRSDEGALCQTEVRIRLLQRMRADAQVTDYRAAIATEATVGTALGATDWAGMAPIVLGDIEREVTGDGTMLLTTLTGTIRHLIP